MSKNGQELYCSGKSEPRIYHWYNFSPIHKSVLKTLYSDTLSPVFKKIFKISGRILTRNHPLETDLLIQYYTVVP